MASPPTSQVIDTEQFSLRFRLLMSYHDLTLRDIAKGTACAISTVGTWKNGRVPSTPETQQQLAKAFGVSVDYLLYGQPNSDASNSMLQEIDDVVDELDVTAQLREARTPFAAKQRKKHKQSDAVALKRDSIEAYLRDYLDQAETQPGGLEHTWYQLHKEFPLDFFERLRHRSLR